MPPAFRYSARWPDIGPEVLRPELADDRYGLPPVTQDDLGHFYALQEVRDKELEDYLSHLSSGGLRFATIVVAASNSRDTDSGHYDFVCSGTNDHTTINNALSALPVAGGTVLLMEGTYDINGPIFRTGGNNNWELRGMGRATVLRAHNSASGLGLGLPMIGTSASGGNQSGVVVSDLTLDGNVANNGGAQYDCIQWKDLQASVRRCRIINAPRIGVETSSVSGSVDGCEVIDCSISGCGTVGIRFRGTGHKVVRGCTIVVDISQAVGIDCETALIAGNVIEATNGLNIVCIYDANDSLVTGNRISGGDFGIFMFTGSHHQVVGNWLTGMVQGIVAWNASITSGVTIRDNTIVATTHEAIVVKVGNDYSITGNSIFGAGTATNNTYDAIFIDGLSNRGDIQHNKVRHDGLANKPRYAINISNANDNDTVVINNDLKNGYVTAGINDVGTATLKNLDGSANNWNRL